MFLLLSAYYFLSGFLTYILFKTNIFYAILYVCAFELFYIFFIGIMVTEFRAILIVFYLLGFSLTAVMYGP